MRPFSDLFRTQQGVVWDLTRGPSHRLIETKGNFGATSFSSPNRGSQEALDVRQLLMDEEPNVIISDLEGLEYLVLDAWLCQEREGVVLAEVSNGSVVAMQELLRTFLRGGGAGALVAGGTWAPIDSIGQLGFPYTLVIARGKPYEDHVRMSQEPWSEPSRLSNVVSLSREEGLVQAWVRLVRAAAPNTCA